MNDSLYIKLARLTDEYRELGIAETLDYEEQVGIIYTFHSTGIEGNSLTLEETALVIKEGRTFKGKLKDHNETQDHYNAYLKIVQRAREKVEITPELIKEINAAIMHSTGSIQIAPLGMYDSSKGEYRLQDVYAGITRFPTSTKVPGMVNKLCTWANAQLVKVKTTEDIFNLAADAHYNLVSIHPFVDGNGRTSRAIMNYIQLTFDQPLIILNQDNKNNYFTALQQSREKEDISIIRTFILDEYVTNLERDIEKVKNQDEGKGIFFSF